MSLKAWPWVGLALLAGGCGTSPVENAVDAPLGHDVGERDGGNGAPGDAGERDAASAHEDAPSFGSGCASTEATRIDAEAGLSVLHHDGQSFVSWRDRAEGEAGAAFRYRLYRSTRPIESDADLADAEVIARRILPHSGQLFGEAFTPTQRRDPMRRMSIVEEGGTPLPVWSGLWVADARANACAYFAVLATDASDVPMEAITPGVNATTLPIAEHVAPRAPILVEDADSRPGPYIAQTRVTGTPGLPFVVELHASSAQGGGAGEYGDYYVYFGDRSMGHRDGTPGVFSVDETHSGPIFLRMRNRDTVVMPDGARAQETLWFGAYTEPDWGGPAHAYPFTEARLDWMIPWAVAHYNADPHRVIVRGGSMGAWGSMSYGFRRPERFAAVYPNRPRMRQPDVRSLGGAVPAGVTLPSGERASDHNDAIRFAESHPSDLPFLGWNCGRRDGFATWEEQVEMALALTRMHHGFAFSWNDGDHASGAESARVIDADYPITRFASNLSYPAFGNSSIDDEVGNGDPSDGDLVGGINLGFGWSDPVESETEWRLEIWNTRATGQMTVDVTPRRQQRFRPAPGTSIIWRDSLGGMGRLVVDEHGLMTVPAMRIALGARTTLTLSVP